MGYPFESVNPYQQVMRQNTSKPPEASFYKDDARITLEQALALTERELAILTDPKLNDLIAHPLAQDHPHRITVEKLLALPPEKIAVLRAKGVAENISGYSLTVEDALQLTPEQGEKVFGNPDVRDLMRAPAIPRNFKLNLKQALTLTPEEIEAIHDSTIRDLIKYGKLTIQEAASYTDGERKSITAARNAIVFDSITPDDAAKLPKETAKIIGSYAVSTLLHKKSITLERAKQLQPDDVEALYPALDFIGNGLISLDTALVAGRNSDFRQLMNDRRSRDVLNTLAKSSNSGVITQIAKLQPAQWEALVTAVSDANFTPELKRELEHVFLVQVFSELKDMHLTKGLLEEMSAVIRLMNPPKIDRPGVPERSENGFDRSAGE